MASLVCLSLGLGVACATPVDEPPGEVGAAASALDVTTTTGPGFTRLDVAHRGAGHTAILPDVWNGHLVTIAHGWIHPALPVGAPTDQAIVAMEGLAASLAANGFGVAFSTYRENGYVVDVAWLDLKFAETLFVSRFGAPDRRFIIGQSMGGTVAQRLVEEDPDRYDGMLSICGALGGGHAQWEYVFDVRVVFDHYYPGVLPGDVVSTPPTNFFGTVVPSVVGAIGANPLGAVQLAAVDQIELQYSSSSELVTGILNVLFLQTQGYAHLMEQAGGNPVGNTDVVYTGSFNDAGLNAGVGRFESVRRAESWLERYYTPSGEIPTTRVLALHTSRDPLVPAARHVEAYGDLVADSGHAANFSTRIIDRFGHCSFAPAEVSQAFGDLVLWTLAGLPPAP